MTFVKPITGRGITTSVGMEAADLGIARWDAKRGANAVMFGDNFTEWGMRGEWQSPSIVMYDDDYNVLGIPTVTGIASQGNRRQLWDYPHGNAEYSTILPCDFIKVAGVWYVAAMVTAGLGNELRTVFWQSRNLVDWQKTNPYVSLQHPGHRGNVMLTFDQIGDYIYIFGTGGLARNEAVFMWRNPASVFPGGLWEPYGYDGRRWGWGIPNDNAPILPGLHGELCFRYIQGNCVISFFDVDEYTTTALTVPRPEDDWTAANRIDYAHGGDWPQLYGGYITPASQLNEPDGMGFLVSQWNTHGGNDPYHVVLFTDVLTAQGPLMVTAPPTLEPEPPAPTPTPPTLAEVPEDVTMTPQELYDLLLRELSASGSVKIPTPEGDTITLRKAVEEIHWKERGLHDMAGRPRHPATSDDQLGHVLSGRAEGLFNQALLVALADQAGIDTAALYAQVQGALK
jgi:Domain of unknown function (DUF4185)